MEWCLQHINAEPDTQTSFDHAVIFSFLQSHLATCSSKEKARVDELLYLDISGLSACHEILVAIRLKRPQHTTRSVKDIKATENRTPWKVSDLQICLSDDDLIELGIKLRSNFYQAPLPTGKRNSAWMQQNQNIRQVLETFWKDLVKTLEMRLPRFCLKADEIREMMKPISITLESDYIESVKAEEGRLMKELSTPQKPIEAQIQTEWGSVSATKVGSPTREKPKTRPANTSPASVNDQITEIRSLEATTQKIHTTKRAYDMISAMFPRSPKESSKNIGWRYFVHAMGI